MEALVQEFYPNRSGFMLKRHSEPPNGQERLDLDFPTSGVAGGEEEEAYGDYSDATLKYISQMLMEEEDLEKRPCMLHDCIALQATEKYFSDVLHGSSDHADRSSSTHSSNASSDPNDFGGFSDCQLSPLESQSGSISPGSDGDFPADNLVLADSNLINLELEDHSPPKGKRNHHSNMEDESAEKQRNKQFATYNDETEPPLEKFNEVLLCNLQEPRKKTDESKAAATRRRRKKREPQKEVVDLRGLLTQCAQAMANYDGRSVTELLTKIRQHSSPHGNGMERLSFYLANALEARLNGAGTAIFTVQFSGNISAADILKAYHMYIKASPFKKISNLYANHFIMKMAAGKNTLHVIDFGVLYGFQWPCMIQGLSNRPGGPPKLKITGIDLPQPGFRPAERVEATGARLKKYCQQFNVPFEFKAIAKRWETIKLEDLEINGDGDEVLAVNCLYRLENVPDETVIPDSPRDIVLGLIHKIRPDVFIHGVNNGTYNSPFFTTRFREAVFHFSTLFDMFEATVAAEDEDRRMFEETVLGRNALNVIACEGTARVERPETYKQWQGRNKRAGFRQVALDQELIKLVKDKARSDYHKDFSVDGDGKWLLQGWKGRVVHALSCWKPA